MQKQFEQIGNYNIDYYNITIEITMNFVLIVTIFIRPSM
jgi:hypothetical protein